jgi:two-component system sensor histidine kinase CpxA
MIRFTRVTSSLKTYALALGVLNATLVLVLGIVLLGLTYRRDPVDFLRAPGGEQIAAVSRKIALDLLESDSDNWDLILQRESIGTPLTFVLLDASGKRIAGPQLEIPDAMLAYSLKASSKLSDIPKWDESERPDFTFIHGRGGKFTLWRDPKTNVYFAGAHVIIHFSTLNKYGHGTLLWRFKNFWTNPYFFHAWPYELLLLGSLMLTALCWLPAMGVLLRRISQLTTATGEIANGNFDSILPPTGNDEIGQLTRSVALMSRQISTLLRHQQRFVSDAAHELCSPIARMQVAIELLGSTDRESLVQKNGGREDYLADLAEEVSAMSELVQDLLFYSRLRNGKVSPRIDKVDLLALVREVIDREANDTFKVEINIPGEIKVLAASSYLRRALANILRNAQQYAGNEGPVELNAHEDGNEVFILISDHGPGLPEAELESVFAPFYRVEYARSRSSGGTGLGLAIVKSAVEVCHGEVQCNNRKPSGLEVKITLANATGVF